ncbi:hypothetical protein I4U23_005600 [Adineta vaga]|nr:hypothetical protein I4U23_005600 [Adineta vaga]
MSSLDKSSRPKSDTRLDSSSGSESDDDDKATKDSSCNVKQPSKLIRYAKWMITNTHKIGSLFVNPFKSKSQPECKSTLENPTINSVDQCTSSIDIFYDADTDVSPVNGYHVHGQEEAIRVSNNCSFDKWGKGRMLKLLTDTHHREFNIELWCDDLEKIKEFTTQNFISCDVAAQQELCAKNIRLEYEKYQYLSNQLKLICNDMQEFIDYIKPNGNQQESHMLVIGDTGVGKSSLINLILEEELMPIDVIKTTSGISLKNNIANQTFTRIDNCDRRYKLEWPVDLLQSGLVLLDSPGSNDTDILTNLIMNTMKRCFVFLCVIQCGITASLKNLLTQLRDNGLTGESIFCVVTYLDDKSPEERLKAIDAAKNEMINLFVNFDKKHCVVLNPKQSLYVLKNYQIYDKRHFEFLRAFIPFISNILSLKISAITDKVRFMAQRLYNKAIKYNYDLLDEEFAKSVRDCSSLKERQEMFQNAKERLVTKTEPIAKKFNTSAIETVIYNFHQDEFKKKFMDAANFLKLPTDISDSINWSDLTNRFCAKRVNSEYGFFGRVRDKRKLTDEHELSLLSSIYLNYQQDTKDAISKVDCYKIYTQLKLIEWIDQYFTKILQDEAEKTMKDVWNTCSEDMQLLDNAIRESYQFLLRENANDPAVKQKYHSVLNPMITNHVKKFSGSKKAALVTVTLGLALATESIYDLFKGYTVRDIEKDSYLFKTKVADDSSVFLGDILDPFECAYLDIEQLSKMSTLIEEIDERKKLCEKYLQRCQNVQIRFDNFQATKLKNWPLDFKKISLNSTVEYKSEFDGSIVKYGILTMHENECKVSHNVVIRSLRHKLNVLQIYDEIKQMRQIENANILRCYGAFIHEEIVHIVTENWSKTLEDFLLDNIPLPSRTILQISVLLIEMIIFLFQYGISTKICSPIILNTNSVLISSDSRIKLNILANKADFLYQPPEYLFPKNFKTSSNQESMNIQHIIYSLGLVLYRLYHQTPEQVALFKSGKWLLPAELVDKITVPNLILRRYTKILAEYQKKDQQFLFQTPVIDTTFSNISGTMKELIQRCYSVDFIQRPTLDEINAIVKFELIRLDGAGCSTGGLLILSSLLRRGCEGVGMGVGWVGVGVDECSEQNIDNDDLICPITMELFRDPVIANDGRVYERSAITQWINEHGTSPFTRQPLQLNELLPDDHLRELAARRRNSVVSYNAQHSTVTLPPLRTGSRNLRRIHPEETNNATDRERDNKACSKTGICLFGCCGLVVLATIIISVAFELARKDSSKTTANGSSYSSK